MRRLAVLLLLLCGLVLCLRLPTPLHAQGNPPAQPTDPTPVRVGIYLLSVNRLDLGTSSYTMDFYLTFSCDQPCDPTNFEFINGRTSSITKEEDTPTSRVYRILADLNANIDLHRYPFDKHTLSLVLEDAHATVNQLVYVSDEKTTGLYPRLFVPGWQLSQHWTSQVNQDYFPVYDESYSRYVFNIAITRPPLTGILKGIFPAVVVVLIGLIALVLKPRDVIQRIELTTAALVGAVLYHITLTSSIPAIGYLTFADRFMILNYAALGLALVTTVGLLVLNETNRQTAQARLSRHALWMIPAAWLIAQLVNIFV